MVKILMHGCNGKMGSVINDICAKDPEVEIVAGVDTYRGIAREYLVLSHIKECKIPADVIVDFSSAAAVDDLLDYVEETKTPVVLCTTGLSDIQIARVEEISKSVAVLRSANMSLGINMIMDLLKKAVAVLEPARFDIEIVEKHHNQKLDAPSGTAIALADAINDASETEYEYVYDRSSVRQKRGAKELGISAVRGGTIVGEHDIIFAGQDEVITISHTAYSKAIFANGAVQAAKYLAGKPAGLYTMKNVISQ